MKSLLFILPIGVMLLLSSMPMAGPGIQAKPDQTKFCAEFNNDDGTTGESCQYKSKGECKKGSIAAGDDFRGCTKNDNGDSQPEEPDGGNNLSPDEDGEGSGSGPND
jgi:hypothetical protein